ncbi:MAG: vitamin B12-dependent ribonucleotide reductase, partial [Pseudomonadota bacterium]
AHVAPQGATFDDLGRGEEEGVSNVKELSENAASKSLEVLKQISSTGYLRKRLPQELVVLNGGQSSTATAFAGDAETALQTLVPETVAERVEESSAAEPVLAGASSLSAAAVDKATVARMQGYEGEACGECGNYTLVRNGTCMKCNTCGATSGCS